MGDSSFNFGLDNLKSSFNEEEDDSEYNKALNDETFANLDSDTDWELNHESYANSQGYPPDQGATAVKSANSQGYPPDQGATAVKSETAQAVDTDEVNDFDKKVRELGESVASYVLDGESDEIVPCHPSELLPTPPSSPWHQPLAQPQPQPQPQPHSSRQFMFVEDIEREMRQNASINPLPSMNTNVPNLSVNAPHPADYRRRRGVVPRLPFEARPPFYERNPHAQPHHMRPPLGVARGGQVHPRFAVPPHHYHQPQPPVAPHLPPVDEYSGLMTIGEKSWLVQIQIQQLNSSQANTNDFYFNQFQQKQQGALRKVNNHVVMKNNREVNNANNKPTYAPLQFENSLGKLQVGSVIAPRKLIDMDVVDKPESNVSIDQDSKSKQLLMEVEEICVDMLKIEECMYRPSSSSQIKNGHMLLCLQKKCLNQLCQENKLVSLMSVKKGKKAVHRLLPLLPDVAPIMKIFLTDLMTIVKKESKDDPTFLLSFLPAIRTFLANVSLAFLNKLLSRYENTFYFSTQFTVSVMANIIERADILLEKCTDQGMIGDWKNRLVSLAQSAEYWKGDRPVVAIAADRLSRHLDLIKDTAAPEQISALTRVLSKPPQQAN